MRIALFPSAFYPSLGGVEELTRQLALELVRRGHDLIILTNRWPRTLPAWEMIDGLPVHRIPFRMPEPGWKARVSHALTGRAMSRRTADVLRDHGTELVHVQCVSSNAHYATMAAEQLAVPLVVTLQGELTMDANRLYQRSVRAGEVLRRALAAAATVTGCSGRTIQDVEAFLGISLDRKKTVVFNAARQADFQQAVPFIHERPYLFALGRLVPQKGFDVLLQAMARVPECGHDVLIAGEGPERERLADRARELGLERRVRWLGRADRSQVASLMKGCEFFVLPSSADEGLPVVCAEAMAAGKAIVATDSGGTAEAVLDGVSGIIVPKGDPDALASAIGRMAVDTPFRFAAERAAQSRAPLFSWSRVTDGYEAVYRQARERHMAGRATVEQR